MTTLDKSDWTAAQLLKRIAGGYSLHGVLCTKFGGITVIPQETIQCPTNVEFVNTTLEFKEESIDLDSKRQYETFNNLLSSFGIKTAAELVIKGSTILDAVVPIAVENSIDFQKTKRCDESVGDEGTHSFLAHIKYGIFPKAAIKLDFTKLKLAERVVEDLQELEREIKICFEIDTIRKKSEQFLKNNGSHVTFGVVNFGGVYQIRATHETRSECSKSYMQGQLRSAVRIGLSGSFSLSEMFKIKASVDGSGNEEITKEGMKGIDVKNETIHVCKMNSGGTKLATNIDEWKEDIENNKTWAIIDRGVDLQRDFKGIWDIVQNNKDCLEHPKGLGVILRYIWQKMSDESIKFEVTDESSANDLVKLMMDATVAKIKMQSHDHVKKKIEKYVTQLETRYDLLGKCLGKYTCAYDAVCDVIAELQTMVEELDSAKLQNLCTKMENSLKPNYTYEEEKRYGLLSELTNTKWTSVKDVALVERPYFIRLIGDCLYVCSRDKGIRIYDLELNDVASIRIRHMEAVFDVAEATYGHLIVASMTGLYTIQRNASELVQIADGYYASVYVHNNLIYAVKHDITKSVIEVYDCNKNLSHKRHAIVIQCSKQQHIKLYVTDSVIYASCAQDRTLYIINHEGKTLIKLVEQYIENLAVCHGDKEGAVLMRGANKLWVLAKDQSCSEVEIEGDICSVRCGVYTRGRLYVVQWNPSTGGNSISMLVSSK